MLLTTDELLNKLSIYEKTISDLEEEKRNLKTELERNQNALNHPNYVFFKSDKVGNISYSNFENHRNRRKNLKDFIPKEETEKLIDTIKEVLNVKKMVPIPISWNIGTSKDNSYTSTLVVPIADEEALIIASPYPFENANRFYNFRNVEIISEILGFLPGIAFIADQNNHLVRIENQVNTPINQIGEAIGCVNFLAADGKCGSMPICGKCQLNASIAKTQKTNRDIQQKQIKIPLNINGKRIYKNFLLTTFCIYIDQKEHYVVYLEDSVDPKIRIKELKASNTLLRSVLDSLPFSIYWKNLNSTFLGGNRTFADQLRIIDRDAIFGLKDEDLFEYNVAKENQRNDEIALKIDQPVLQNEYNYELLEHKITQNSIKASLHDDSGNKIGIVGSTIEFSSQKWYELDGGKKNSTDLESISDQLDFAIWEWHLNTDRLTGNNRWKSMMGVDISTATVQHYLQNIDINDQEKIIAAKEEIHNSGKYKFNHQFRYLSPKEKKTKWIQISGKILHFDIHGNPVKLVGNAKDITEQKEIEIRCQLESQFNSALLNSSKDSIWSIDHNFRITFINQTFKANFFLLFGVELEVGDYSFDALEKPLQVKWKKRFRKALKGSSFKVTDEFFNEGLLYKKTEILFSPILINEEIVGASCFSRDITKTSRLIGRAEKCNS